MPKGGEFLKIPSGVSARCLEPGTSLLLLIEPDGPPVDLPTWAARHRAELEQELYRYGALLFRGFDVSMPDGFRAFADGMSDLMEYLYRSTPRTNLAPRIYTSTEYPPERAIPPHCEVSYQRDWPMKLFFGCEIPPESGGRTPLAEVAEVTGRIDPEIRRAFAARKVMYVRNYGTGADLPWQTVFQTADPREVERFCAEQDIQVEWLPGGNLRTRQVCQGMAVHPVTGQTLWFNQAHLFHVSSLDEELREALLALYGEENLPRNAYYGDGSPLEEEVLEHIRQAFEQVTLSFPWQRGDILMLDNMLVSHAREPYAGKRKILAAMGDRRSTLREPGVAPIA
jgi:alpha-ketoglutarate-dependent taurine dioxygenase